MKLRGAILSVCTLAAVLLLAAMVCTFIWLPDISRMIPDEALQGPRVTLLLHILLPLPLLAGLLATVQLRRMLAWPWLWLAAILLLRWRPELDLINQLLSLAAELSLLLIFSIAETMLYIWREHWSSLARRLALPVTGLLLLWIAAGSALTPDNPRWQGLLGLLGALCLLGNMLHEELRPRLTLPVLNRISGQVRGILEHHRRLRNLRLPKRSGKAPAASAADTIGVRERPMLSLGEGYLVSHEAESSADQRRRRTG
jgi:hypothetical protein